MNWFITGGCGFVGTNLIKRLVNMTGHHVRVFDNMSVGDVYDLRKVCSPVYCGDSDAFSQVDFVSGSIEDFKILKQSMEGADVVVHLAAKSGVRESVEQSRTWFNNNVLGTFNVLEAVKENDVKTLITASSGAAVGETDPPITETILPQPISPYGASKLCGEAYCNAYYHSYGMNAIALRFSNVYGPLSHKKNSLVAKAIRYALKGQPLPIYGDGTQTRDFIFVDDLTNAIVKCAHVDKIDGVFQICTGKEMSVNNIIKTIQEILNTREVYLNLIDMEQQPGDIQTNWASNAKIKKVISWEPTTGINEGLHKTIDWFLEESKKCQK